MGIAYSIVIPQKKNIVILLFWRMRISMDFLAIPQYHTILPTSPPPAPHLTGVFVKATGNDHHPRRGTTSQSLKIPGGNAALHEISFGMYGEFKGNL